jgi:hypothetical protein
MHGWTHGWIVDEMIIHNPNFHPQQHRFAKNVLEYIDPKNKKMEDCVIPKTNGILEKLSPR